MAEKDIVVPELDEDGRLTADSVIEQIGEIAEERGGNYAGEGNRSVQIGGESATGRPGRAAGTSSVAVGPGTQAFNVGSVALGNGSRAGLESGSGSSALAIGNAASAAGSYSVAIGPSASSTEDHTMVLGPEMGLSDDMTPSGPYAVRVPGALELSEHNTLPEHAARRDWVEQYVDENAGGGGGLPGIHAGVGRPDKPDTLDQPVPDDAVLFVSTDGRAGATMWTRPTEASALLPDWSVAAGRLELAAGGYGAAVGADLAIFESGQGAGGVNVVEEVGGGWIRCVYSPGIHVDLEAYVPARQALTEGQYLGFLIDPAVNDSPGGLDSLSVLVAEVSSPSHSANPITPQSVTFVTLGPAPDGREMLAFYQAGAEPLDLGDKALNIKASYALSPYLGWPGMN